MSTPAQLADPAFWLAFSRGKFIGAETMEDLEAAGQAMIAFAWILEPDVALDFDIVAAGLESCHAMVTAIFDELALQRDNAGCVALRALMDRIEQGVAVLSLYGADSPHMARLCWRAALRDRRRGVTPDASDWIVPDAGGDATGPLYGNVLIEHADGRREMHFDVAAGDDDEPPRTA